MITDQDKTRSKRFALVVSPILLTFAAAIVGCSGGSVATTPLAHTTLAPGATATPFASATLSGANVRATIAPTGTSAIALPVSAGANTGTLGVNGAAMPAGSKVRITQVPASLLPSSVMRNVNANYAKRLKQGLLTTPPCRLVSAGTAYDLLWTTDNFGGGNAVSSGLFVNFLEIDFPQPVTAPVYTYILGHKIFTGGGANQYFDTTTLGSFVNDQGQFINSSGTVVANQDDAEVYNPATAPFIGAVLSKSPGAADQGRGVSTVDFDLSTVPVHLDYEYTLVLVSCWDGVTMPTPAPTASPAPTPSPTPTPGLQDVETFALPQALNPINLHTVTPNGLTLNVGLVMNGGVGSMTVKQWDRLPPNGCVPAGQAGGTVAQVVSAIETTFSADNVLTFAFPSPPNLTLVYTAGASVSPPSGTYYGGFFKEGSCSNPIPVYSTIGSVAALRAGQLVSGFNGPLVMNAGDTWISVVWYQ